MSSVLRESLHNNIIIRQSRIVKPWRVPDGEEDVVYLVEDGVDGPRRYVVGEYPVAQQRTLDKPGQTMVLY